MPCSCFGRKKETPDKVEEVPLRKPDSEDPLREENSSSDTPAGETDISRRDDYYRRHPGRRPTAALNRSHSESEDETGKYF